MATTSESYNQYLHIYVYIHVYILKKVTHYVILKVMMRRPDADSERNGRKRELVPLKSMEQKEAGLCRSVQ